MLCTKSHEVDLTSSILGSFFPLKMRKRLKGFYFLPLCNDLFAGHDRPHLSHVYNSCSLHVKMAESRGTIQPYMFDPKSDPELMLPELTVQGEPEKWLIEAQHS